MTVSTHTEVKAFFDRLLDKSWSTNFGNTPQPTIDWGELITEFPTRPQPANQIEMWDMERTDWPDYSEVLSGERERVDWLKEGF